MKILTIVGARPQFVKAAAVQRALLQFSAIKEVVVHTGQHFDGNMSDVFFEQMQIRRPDYNLGIHGLTHGAMTGLMLSEIEKVLQLEKPDVMLVYGDTNSTLAGALAASKLQIPVAHVEAGLRSFNMRMPEEINRILTDRISQYLFCPTEQAVSNLKREGFEHFGCKIHQVGDVMYDAALYYSQFAEKPAEKMPNEFALVTIHREENTTTENLQLVMRNLEKAAELIHLVWPVHPRTRNLMQQLDIQFNTDKITLLDPVGYFQMIWLLQNSRLVLTDSGGVQKEAYFFSRPCITLRNETEWTELVECGANSLVGLNTDALITAIKYFLINTVNFTKPLYGQGNAAELILKNI